MGSKSSKNIKDTLGKAYTCPLCDKVFPPNTHMKEVYRNI